jgi:hypothetical protein
MLRSIYKERTRDRRGRHGDRDRRPVVFEKVSGRHPVLLAFELFGVEAGS